MTEDGEMETMNREEDPGMEAEADVSLLQTFEHIYQDYKELVSEVHTVRSNYNLEVKRRESLEISVASLKQENKRLRKLNLETLANFTHQFECHSKYQRLKEELSEANRKSSEAEAEHVRRVEKLERELGLKIQELEKQKLEGEARVMQLSKELALHKSGAMERESKCEREIRELRDWMVVEQEEKNELLKKLQDAEMELMRTRSKQADHQRESISIRHVEALKQKLMKLRKENESLKRRLSDLHCP